MPQGGVETLDDEELLLKGMFRELYEETGIVQSNVKILGRSHKVKYEFTEDVVFKNKDKFGNTIGQEQIWFFLRFLGKDLEINLKADKHQEFFDWKWETPYFLIDHVMQMKKSVYKDILNLLIQNNYFK
jgi:putative (di)nucleoside polyphosphate hydrolase